MSADHRDDAVDPESRRETVEGAPPDADPDGPRCWNCGEALPEGAMFCGECGSAAGARTGRAIPGASATPDPATESGAELSTGPREAGTPRHGDALLDAPPGGPARTPAAERTTPGKEDGTPPHGDPLAGDALPDPAEVPDQPDQPDQPSQPARPDQPGQPDQPDPPDRPDPDRTDQEAGGEDLEDGDVDPLAPLTAEERFAAERLLDPDSAAGKFVLQFSTGDTATVYGSGLIGRSPHAEPGEYVDQLVVVRDPGRSVSKTHLEFGQEHGVFWVLDRFSGNGSVVREPDAEARRCEPGRRYFVVRGTRIDLGDQFFVVS